MKNLALTLGAIAAALYIAQSAWNAKVAADNREAARIERVNKIIDQVVSGNY